MKYLFLLFFISWLLPLAAQDTLIVYKWDQADIPPLFHAAEPDKGETFESLAQRQLLEEIYRRIKGSHYLHTQDDIVNVAATLTFRANGTLRIKQLFLVNAEAPAYFVPDENERVEVRHYPASHPNRELINRIIRDAAFRASREQLIYRDVLRVVEKVLRSLPKFIPAIKDGEQANTSRTLTFTLRSEFN